MNYFIKNHFLFFVIIVCALNVKQFQCFGFRAAATGAFRRIILQKLNEVQHYPDTLLTQDEAIKIQNTVINPKSSTAMLNYMFYTLENYIRKLRYTPENLRDNYFYNQMTTLGPIDRNSFEYYHKYFENITDIKEVRRLIKNDLVLTFGDWISLIENHMFLNKNDSQINEFELLDETFEVAKFRKVIRDNTQSYDTRIINNDLVPINFNYIESLRIILDSYYKQIARINRRTCYLNTFSDMQQLIRNKNSSAPLFRLMGQFASNIFYSNSAEYYVNTYRLFLTEMLNILFNEIKSYETHTNHKLQVSNDDISRFLFKWTTSTLKDDSRNAWQTLEHQFHAQTYKQIFWHNACKSSEQAARSQLIYEINQSLPKLAMAINLANGDRNFLQQLQSIHNIVQQQTSFEMLVLCRNIVKLGLTIDYTRSMTREMNLLELEYLSSRLNSLGSIPLVIVDQIMSGNQMRVHSVPDNALVLLVAKQWKENIVNELRRQNNPYSQYFQILEHTFSMAIHETIDYLNKKIFYKLICNDNQQILGI